MLKTTNDLDIRGLKDITTKMLLPNGRYPLFIGDRGIGKSQIAFQIIEELGAKAFYFNASQTDPESLIFPVIKEMQGFDEDGNPKLGDKVIDLVTVGGLAEDNIVVLIDELTNARPSLHSFLLSFVADRRIGTKVFNNVSFIATGNRTSNSSLAQALPRPLMERFCIIDSPVPSRHEWVQYMRDNYPSVPSWYYGFMLELPQKQFYQQEEEGGDVEDFRQLPSPRSHTYAATTLSGFESAGQALNHLNAISTVFKGYLGEAVAARFIAYLQDSENFLTFKQYKKGKTPKNAAQAINLAVDAAENLRPLYEKGDKKSRSQYFEEIDQLFHDVHSTRNVTNLAQFVLDTLVDFNQQREIKSNYVSWMQDNSTTSKGWKIVQKRLKMNKEVQEEFGNLARE